MTYAIDDLAVFGAPPEFDTPVHVNAPSLGEREVFHRLANEAWDRKWFSNDGPLVLELEARLERRLEVEHCILTSSGTTALSVLILALGLSGEVIIPSFTFVSTPHALRLAGIDPVFADIGQTSCNIGPAQCEPLISERTSAIIATHLWGGPCDVAGLKQLADERKIRLFFDAAHAFGCSHQGKPIGGFGDAEIFSFHATKIFQTGEGGAITTNDPDLAKRARSARNFGFSGLDETEGIGTNAKMPELAAALGLANLEAFDTILARAARNHEVYQTELSGVARLRLQVPECKMASNNQYVVGLLDDGLLDRNMIVEILHAENVYARRYFYPGCHRLEPHKSRSNGIAGSLQVTEEIADRVLVLPGGASVTPDEVRRVCSLLKKILDNEQAVNERLCSQS